MWDERPAPLSSHPPAWKPLSDPAAQSALEAEVADLVRIRAVDLVLRRSSPGFYGRLFVVPKASGGWRPVLDLSALNIFLRKIRFRMESPTSVREAIRPGDWATSIDLKDAYFHVMVHRAHRKYLRFAWKDKVYQFRALPFGLSLAPWVFTRVVREVCALVRDRGVRMRAYLDDWLVLSQSQQQCSESTGLVLHQSGSLGFALNESKSELSPSQDFVYLGMRFDTVAFLVRPAPARVTKLLALVRQLLAADRATARQLTSLLGTMESFAMIVPLGRVFKRPLQRLFRACWKQSRDSWDQKISLGPHFAQALLPWTDKDWLQKGVPIVLPPPDKELFTDASMLGWGAHCDQHSVHGVWSEGQMALHINLLEMEAAFLALSHFHRLLCGLHVRLVTDSQSVCAYINRQGGVVSPELSRRAENLLIQARSWEITVSARHIAGVANILADQLSRPHSILNTEWTLSHRVLDQVWQLWHKPMVDLFATCFSRRLPLYMSPVPDPCALAIDALAQCWTGLEAYAFPPLPLLEKVVRKAELEAPSLILVAPFWPAQPWFADLRRLARCPPLQLDVRGSDLCQPRSGIPHGNPHVLALHAWLL